MTVVRQARLDEIIVLRHAILRANTVIENAYFAEDQLANTYHFGAFAAEKCIGCATFLSVDFEQSRAWQLRGMAVDRTLHQTGIGRRMLIFAEQFLAGISPVRQMWCHARVVAVPFYLRCGWEVVSEQYEMINIPHVTMTRAFADRIST